jgi:hypothetical protein
MHIATTPTQKTQREAYIDERKKRGTQAEVAAMLEVTRQCIQRRENGKSRITREAMLAIRALPFETAQPVPVVNPVVRAAAHKLVAPAPAKAKPRSNEFEDQCRFSDMINEIAKIPKFKRLSSARWNRLEDGAVIVNYDAGQEAFDQLNCDDEDRAELLPIIQKYFPDCDMILCD